MKERVLGMPPQPGVYMIMNVINRKSYIGSTSNLMKRLNAHRCNLINNKHANVKLQRAFNKYGVSSFISGVIEYCHISELEGKEQLSIDFYKPFFNIRTVANSNKGVRLSIETRIKMSNAHKGKRAHINSAAALIMSNKNRAGKRTDKMKEALNSLHRYMIGKPKTNATKKLISLSKQGKKLNKITRKFE
jgi:group I intron endonuclease